MANKNWTILKPVRPRINLAMAYAVLGQALSFMALLLIAYCLHQLLLGRVLPIGLLAALVALLLAGFVLRGLGFKTSHLAAFALEAALRTRLAAHFGQLSMGKMHDLGASTLAKIMHDDVRELHVFVADATPLYARVYAAPVLTFAALLYLDWRMAILCAVAIVFGMVVMAVLMRRMGRDVHVEYHQRRENVSQAVVEYVQAMQVVRTFDSGKQSFGRYQQALIEYRAYLVNWYQRYGLVARSLMAFLNPLPSLLLILWCGALWWWQDSLTLSTWLAVLLIGTGIAEAWMPYYALMHLLEKVAVSVARIEEILALAPQADASQPAELADYSIEFQNVSFAYPARREQALDAVSFKVPSGSLTAIIGSSGAGKSTVARLLARFWDIGSGQILIGGVPIQNIPQSQLMDLVGFVFQENFLFADSVANNIALGMPNASQAEIEAAAKAAQVHDFIMRLPEGYATHCAERGNLFSGGERQRITIARAILQNRPILVLDEATAFADANTEALIMTALNHLMRDKTVVMIAHRLGSVKNAQQILLLANGKLKEAGTHQSLLAQAGEYAALQTAWQQTQNWHIGTGVNHG